MVILSTFEIVAVPPRFEDAVDESSADVGGLCHGRRIADRLDRERTLDLEATDPDRVVIVEEVRLRDDARDTVDHDGLGAGITQLLHCVQQLRRVDRRGRDR